MLSVVVVGLERSVIAVEVLSLPFAIAAVVVVDVFSSLGCCDGVAAVDSWW